MLDASVTALSVLFTWQGLLILTGGTLLCMLTSFVPGIGSASFTSLLLILTMSWQTEYALILFGALVGGATFMGSITAILFNVPGSAPSASALLDGYPLAQRGYVKRAISCAATASALGSIIGVFVLILLMPFLAKILLEIGPFERALLAFWGLVTLLALPGRGGFGAALMAILGLTVGMIGLHPATGDPRWTFGILELEAGVNTVAAFIGFFAFSELLLWTDKKIASQKSVYQPANDDSTVSGIFLVLKHRWLLLRSSLIGTLIGAIPGAGGTVAGFVAYGHAVQSSKSEDSEFGKGDIRGLIAPESATDAKDGGSLIPAIAFGLPGNEMGVLLILMFSIHGLNPGEGMLGAQLSLTLTLIFALLFSNLLTSAVGISAAPFLAKIKEIQIERFAVPLIVVSCLALVQLNASLIDVYMAVLFGIFGYFCKKTNLPKIPFVIAFVLSSFLEQNITLSAQLIELGRLNPFRRPASLVIFLMLAMSVAYIVFSKKRSKHDSDSQDEISAVALVTLTLLFSLFMVESMQRLPRVGVSETVVIAGFLVAASTLVCQSRKDSFGVINAFSRPPEGLKTQLALNPLLLTVSMLPVAIFLFGFSAAIGVLVASSYVLRNRALNGRDFYAKALIALLIGALGSEAIVDLAFKLNLESGLLTRLLLQQ